MSAQGKRRNPMTRSQINALRTLRGRDVDVALVDGSSIDHATLVSIGNRHTSTLWLQAGDDDLFVALADVRAVHGTRLLCAAR
jgi:hypothetical protein